MHRMPLSPCISLKVILAYPPHLPFSPPSSTMSFDPTFGGFGDFATVFGLIVKTCEFIRACYKASDERNAVIDALQEYKDSLELWKPILQELQDLLISSPQSANTTQSFQLQSWQVNSRAPKTESLLAVAQTVQDAMAKCYAAIDSFFLCLTKNMVVAT